MPETTETSSQRKDQILRAAMLVFGRLGYKKASVDDIAKAAEISKPGLYLHFSGKEEIFLAAHLKYLDDAVTLLDQALSKDGASLFERICGAMDVWFGRHFSTFSPQSFDVIEAGNQLSKEAVEKYKVLFRSKVAKALSESREFARAQSVCTPKEVAHTLFTCGLSWKEAHESRSDFMKKMATCVKVCCRVSA